VIPVTLVDYGAGNMASVIKGLRAAGAEVATAVDPGHLESARAIVIPGVGHFAATATLDGRWRDAVRSRLDAGAALLGICLGMQWLFDGSDEAPEVAGLGVFAGVCRRIQVDDGSGLKVPHVGWNTLDASSRAEARDLRPHVRRARVSTRAASSLGNYAYFTHSYAAPVTDDTVATTTHGVVFASTIARGRVCGTQWHPEKSGETGLQVLRNFLALASEAR
jgi:glutamine amidotransferase